MSPGMRFQALCLLKLLPALLGDSGPCISPKVYIVSPIDDAILPAASTIRVLTRVECATFPGDVFVRVWDATTRDSKNYVDMYKPQVGVLGNVVEGACTALLRHI